MFKTLKQKRYEKLNALHRAMYDNFDFSKYARELTDEEACIINGGAEVENSNEGVAGAQVGDTVTRDDGSTHTITQGDIDWAREQTGGNNTDKNNNSSQNPQGNPPVYQNKTADSNTKETSSNLTDKGYPDSKIGWKLMNAINKLLNAIKIVGAKDYVEGEYQCDEYVNEVIRKAGLDPKDYYVDDPSGKTVDEHIADLKLSGKDYSMVIPEKPGYYCTFMDGEGSLGKLDSHCGILEVKSDGSMIFYHNSSSNDNNGVFQQSTVSQKGGTKLSGLAYSNFYFQKIG
ncbi:MAG: hypothetical protein IKX23_07545 [Treponema sp.]|nr:hypothetical protein [Treponema sp.]